MQIAIDVLVSKIEFLEKENMMLKATLKQENQLPDRSKETHEDAVKRYLDHPKEETVQQRMDRINRFRCGY